MTTRLSDRAARSSKQMRGSTPPISALEPEALGDNLLLAPEAFVRSLSASISSLEGEQLHTLIVHTAGAIASLKTLKYRQLLAFVAVLQFECTVALKDKFSAQTKEKIIAALFCISNASSGREESRDSALSSAARTSPPLVGSTDAASSFLATKMSRNGGKENEEEDATVAAILLSADRLGLTQLLVARLVSSYPSCPMQLLNAVTIARPATFDAALTVACTSTTESSQHFTALCDLLCRSASLCTSLSPLSGLQVALTTAPSLSPRRFVGLMRITTALFASMIVEQQKAEMHRREEVGLEQEDRQRQGLDPALVIQTPPSDSSDSVLVGNFLGLIQDLFFSNNIIIQSHVASFVRLFTLDTLFGLAITQQVKANLMHSGWYENCPAFVTIVLLLLDNTDDGVLAVCSCLMDEDRGVRRVAVLAMLQLIHQSSPLDTPFNELADTFKRYAAQLVTELLASSEQRPRVANTLLSSTPATRQHTYTIMQACDMYDHVALSMAIADADVYGERELAVSAIKYIVADGVVGLSIDRTRLSVTYVQDVFGELRGPPWRQLLILQEVSVTPKWEVSRREDFLIAVAAHAWACRDDAVESAFLAFIWDRFLADESGAAAHTTLAVNAANALLKAFVSHLIRATDAAERVRILTLSTQLAPFLQRAADATKRLYMQILEVLLEAPDVHVRAAGFQSASALQLLNSAIFTVAMGQTLASNQVLSHAAILYVFGYASAHVPRLSQDQKLAVMERAVECLAARTALTTSILSACLRWLWALCDSYKKLNGVDELNIKSKLVDFISNRLSLYPMRVQQQALVFISHAFALTADDASLLLTIFRASRGTVKSGSRALLCRAAVVESLEMLDIQSLDQAISLIEMAGRDPRFAVASASCLFRYASAENRSALGKTWDEALEKLAAQNQVIGALLQEASRLESQPWPQPLMRHLLKIGLKDPSQQQRRKYTHHSMQQASSATTSAHASPKKPKRRQLPSAPKKSLPATPTKGAARATAQPQAVLPDHTALIEELQDDIAALQQELDATKEVLKEERHLRLLLEHDNEDLSNRLGATQANLLAKERKIALAHSPAPPKPARKSQKSQSKLNSMTESFKLANKALTAVGDQQSPLLDLLRNWQSRHSYRYQMIRGVSRAIATHSKLDVGNSENKSLFEQWAFALRLVIGVIDRVLSSLRALLHATATPTLSQATDVIASSINGIAAISQLTSLSLRLVRMNVMIPPSEWAAIAKEVKGSVPREIAVPATFNDVLSFGANEFVLWEELLSGLEDLCVSDADVNFVQATRAREEHIRGLAVFSIRDSDLAMHWRLTKQHVLSEAMAHACVLGKWPVSLTCAGDQAEDIAASTATAAVDSPTSANTMLLLASCVLFCRATRRSAPNGITLQHGSGEEEEEEEDDALEEGNEGAEGSNEDSYDFARVGNVLSLDELTVALPGLGLNMLSLSSTHSDGAKYIVHLGSKEDVDALYEALTIQMFLVREESNVGLSSSAVV